MPLDAKPSRTRPSATLKAAIWAVLLCPVGELRARHQASVALPAPGTPWCLDALAEVLVLRALHGNVRAFKIIAGVIEGRVVRRDDSVSTDPPASADRLQVIENILAALAERPRAS